MEIPSECVKPVFCLCEICVCGTHKCKHNRHLKNIPPISKDSEYSWNYAAKEKGRRSISAKPLAFRSAPITVGTRDSIYHTEFQDYGWNKRDRLPVIEPAIPLVAMSFNTSYGQDYQSYRVPRRKIKELKERSQPPSFTGNSTYRGDFVKKEPLPCIQRVLEVRCNPPVEWTADSEYSHNYRGLLSKASQSAKPLTYYKEPVSKVTDATEYRLNYVPIDPPLCPAVEVTKENGNFRSLGVDDVGHRNFVSKRCRRVQQRALCW